MHGRRLNLSFCTLAITLAATLAGCGGETRYHVSGEVTFEGEPVEQGTIVFTQEGGRGGHASIREGKFNTADDGNLGALAGDNIVTIKGYQVPSEDNPDAPRKPLFQPHETQLNVTGNLADQKFEVP